MGDSSTDFVAADAVASSASHPGGEAERLTRLLDTEQGARRQAERAQTRMARLQSVTARLGQAVTVAHVGDVILSEGAAALDAHRGVLALLTAEGDALEVVRTQGYAPAVTQAWQQFALDAPIPLADATRQRDPIWLHDVNERDHRYPQLARIQTTSQAYAVLPLIVEDRVLGGLSFGFNHPRPFDAEERAFITALAQQCAQALERARLYDVAAVRLAEIETLNTRLSRALAETHHRVKNNLQVISALVELQTDASATLVPADALRRIGGHARALASLHDLLTDQAKASGDIAVISARALLSKMIPHLQTTIHPRVLYTDVEDVRLPVRIGASLCLLLNELVSNAVKHGGNRLRLSLNTVPDRRSPEEPDSAPPLSERRSNPEEPVASLLCLTVEDDGPGFPPGFDPIRAAHTGLDLVANISRLDLGGSVRYANRPEGGARVSVLFPLPLA